MMRHSDIMWYIAGVYVFVHNAQFIYACGSGDVFIDYTYPNITCGNLTCYGPFTAGCNETLDNPCDCVVGILGEECQLDLDECGPGHRPCGTGGICVNTIASFACICLKGWGGCSCHDRIDNETECIPGWTGLECRADIDECKHPALFKCGIHQRCLNRRGNYTCVCDHGWTGDSCETDIDECAAAYSSCQNGATCRNLEGSYECICPPAWTGINCTQENHCYLTPCLHSQECRNWQPGKTCSCLNGWSGDNCTADINECVQTPCLHEANCTNTDGSFVCTCQEDWEGELCETVVSTRLTTQASQDSRGKSNTTLLVVGFVLGCVVVVLGLVVGLFVYIKKRENKTHVESSPEGVKYIPRRQRHDNLHTCQAIRLPSR